MLAAFLSCLIINCAVMAKHTSTIKQWGINRLAIYGFTSSPLHQYLVSLIPFLIG